ncbi:MAG TPA: L,D-transpeptidase [Acidimicrobiales bacterium]|nr:L,D-transpeptidase [Acidimicrobiales bacterium]
MGHLRRVGGAVVVIVLAVVTAGCGTRAAGPRAAPRPHHAAHRTKAAVSSTPTTVATASANPFSVPASTLVATTNSDIPGYTLAGASTPSMTVPGSWYGYPSILPVITALPGWLEVRLAQRPNGSTIWVHQSDVTISNTPYAIVVDLATMHLLVYDAGTQVFDFPAGVGAPDDPTPTGQYFMPMLYPSPGPGYGPFVLVTSDHSDTITDWENSGDAIIGIHGPITSYDDSLIGTTGAAISHGCIRLHDADLAQLAGIPAGTPIDVVS